MTIKTTGSVELGAGMGTPSSWCGRCDADSDGELDDARSRADGRLSVVARPLMLLDAASLYFRAFYAVPDTITAPDGMPVNAVRGFCDMVARLIDWRRPARLVACLDLDWRPAFRVHALPTYKAHRVDPAEPEAEAVPDLLEPQVPVICDVLAAAGLATSGAAGYEADDVIGALADRERHDPVEVVSGDRDLFQVVREEPTPIRVVYAGRGLAKAEVIGPAELATRYGVPVLEAGPRYADMAALRGDPSDGLPGVPGVGEKTAASLVSRFGSIEDLLAAVDDPDANLAPAMRTKLTRASDYLQAAPSVVRVAVDAPVELDREDTIPSTPADMDALGELQVQWGLDGPIERLITAMAKTAAQHP